MQEERKPRLVRVNDFVADNLEAEADMMPPWTKFQAGIWRDVAKDLRASESTKMVRVWEEPEPQGISHAPSCLFLCPPRTTKCETLDEKYTEKCRFINLPDGF